MTLYDSGSFFVPNPAKIYLVNNRSRVHFNADHSLDIYIQPRLRPIRASAPTGSPPPPASRSG